MGNLKPGATYIYERADGMVYAREFGADPSTRQVVGYDNTAPGHRMLSELNDILVMCESDPVMKELLNKLFVLYNLKKAE